jgi:hypothetical protein
MSANRTRALEDAEIAFCKTTHGSVEEKEVLTEWRNLCETEDEEQIAISAYLRRKQEAKVAEKKAARRKKTVTSRGVKDERARETQKAPKAGKRRGKKGVRPNWWENY